MAPVKFGLFRARSRDQNEQPSTENLLQNSATQDSVQAPGSPIPSTSKGFETDPVDISELQLHHLQLDSDDDDETLSEKPADSRRISDCSKTETDDAQLNYLILKNQASTDATSVSTLNDEDYEHIQDLDPSDSTRILDQVLDDSASTTYDANSLQFDEASIAPSEDVSVHCGPLKKGKKSRLKEQEKLMRDCDMWRASNVEVMENLLNRSGTLGDQYKWEAIATARGLCTLTNSCTCRDCSRAKYLAGKFEGMADGDGGMATAPMFTALSIGCNLQ